MAIVTFNGNNCNLRLTYTEEINATKNSSTITITKIEGQSTAYTYTFFLDGYIAVNGSPLMYYSASQGTAGNWMSKGVWYEFLIPEDAVSVELPHQADGTLALTFQLYGNSYSKFFFVSSDGTINKLYFTNGLSQSVEGTKIEQGIVRIYTSQGWRTAVPHIFNGTSWSQGTPQVYDGSQWKKAIGGE